MIFYGKSVKMHAISHGKSATDVLLSGRCIQRGDRLAGQRVRRSQLIGLSMPRHGRSIKMLERKIEKKILDWLSSGKRALLIDGARQVGKTYSIRRCLEKSGADHLEVNLLEDRNIVSALQKSVSVNDLTVNLSAATGHELKKGETVIFIDEVQELRELVTMIKFWVDEGSYRYILSGSLLGIELQALRSAPVGYVNELKMFPLDFEEFMKAAGVTDTVIDHLKQSFADKTPVGEAIHQKIMTLFRRFLVVGGMPQAVQEYADTGNIGRITEIQADIVNFYKRDFTKYEKADGRFMISSVYEKIPSELLKQNRRFNYADIKKGLRFERIENTFLWLYKSGVVLPAFNSTEPVIPLKLNEKSSLVKLYYSDVGLLTFVLGEALRREILYGDRKINLGGIFENAVIQELYAHGFEVYYYNSKKLGELDFVIENDNGILPIEVKSGKDYYVHSAIDNVLKNEGFGINEALIFSAMEISVSDKITNCPVYMSAFLERSKQPFILDKLSF